MANDLDDSIVDDLLTTVDDIRGDLLPLAGIRTFDVYTMTRTWSGVEVGDGDSTDVETLLFPTPKVAKSAPKGISYTVRPQGREEDGDLWVTELSMAQYAEDDLTGGDLSKNVEFFWILKDGHGQGARRRAYTLGAVPIADRENTIGWVVNIVRAEE